MRGLTYDTGALIAAERGAQKIWTMHFYAASHGIVPLVPACVLAEAWRGGPQASLSRFLAGCTIEPLTELGARRVGAFAAKAGRLRAASSTSRSSRARSGEGTSS